MNEVALYSVPDMKAMASAMAGTGMFGFKKPDEAFALMLIAQAEGKHPATVAQEYDIIQNRPALKSMAALARFQHAGGSIQWHSRTDTEASATLSHPQGGDLRVSWTMERANKAGLTGKDNWKKFPAQMLSARVVSEGVRACFPACLNGMYVAEEVQDFEPRRAAPAGLDPVNEILPENDPAEAEALRADILSLTSKYLAVALPNVKADIEKAGDSIESLLRVKGGVERSIAKAHKPSQEVSQEPPPPDDSGAPPSDAVYVQSVEEKQGPKATFWVIGFSNGVEATAFSSTDAETARQAQAEGLPISADTEVKGKFTNLTRIEIV